MSPKVPQNPLRYTPQLENLAADDPQLQKEIIEEVGEIIAIGARQGGHAARAVHAKSQAFVVGEATILPDLPDNFRQGLFAKPASWPVLMRFSTLPNVQLDDEVSVPRGLGLKFIGVEGERLPDFADDVTQDFLLSNGPIFPATSVKAYAAIMKMMVLDATVPERVKLVTAALMQRIGDVMEKLGVYDKKLYALGDYPPRHVFNDSYCTQGSLLFGDYMAKLELVPVSPELRALGEVDIKPDRDALRAAANAYLKDHEAEWELRAQLCVDIEKMPIEDPSVAWPEELSPYVPIARIRARPQIAWSEERAKIDDTLSFNPWRGLAAHRPLGAIMRLRRAVYLASSGERAKRNRVMLCDPRSVADLPPVAPVAA